MCLVFMWICTLSEYEPQRAHKKQPEQREYPRDSAEEKQFAKFVQRKQQKITSHRVDGFSNEDFFEALKIQSAAFFIATVFFLGLFLFA
jgi:hypothetical protein